MWKYTDGIWVVKRGEEGAAGLWQRRQRFGGGWGRKAEEGGIKTGIRKIGKVQRCAFCLGSGSPITL